MTASKLSIDERESGDVTILTLSGQLVLDDGDRAFRRRSLASGRWWRERRAAFNREGTACACHFFRGAARGARAQQRDNSYHHDPHAFSLIPQRVA